MASRALRFSSQLKELRIHLCQKSPESQGVRDFIEQQYVKIKKENPRFPILIRECSGVSPKIWARYELGRESNAPVSNLSSKQVLDTIESLASKTA